MRHGVLDPRRHGSGADVPALAHEIGDAPVFLALLDPRELQGEQFAAPQPTAQEDGEHRVITKRSSRGVLGG